MTTWVCVALALSLTVPTGVTAKISPDQMGTSINYAW